MGKEGITMHPDTCKRIAKDVRSLLKDSLDSEGIYYKHSETNVLTGYAIIIGNPHGVYRDGVFLFKFKFPTDYPYRPPIVTFLTNDGITRFHPNLYRNGKICLSILNTWTGEKWSSCQSIRSILLTLSNLLDEDPLLHEPGISNRKNHENDRNIFKKCVEFKSIEFAYCSLFEKMVKNTNTVNKIYLMFQDIIQNHYEQSIHQVLTRCKNKGKDNKNIVLEAPLYRDMRVTVDYSDLENRLESMLAYLISSKNESKNNIS